jgi:DNA-binding NarL/FixJ family response regulator
LLAQGYTRSGIAEYMQISTNTVRTHIRHIMKKLGAASGHEAAQIAKRKGLF